MEANKICQDDIIWIGEVLCESGPFLESWEIFAKTLLISSTDIYDLKRNERNISNIIFKILEIWISQKSPTFVDLIRPLRSREQNLCADQIMVKLAVKENDIQIPNQNLTPSKPNKRFQFWKVPRSNHNFSGREELLSKLQATFKKFDPYSKSVITTCKGLGGIGKTSAAIQFAYTLRGRSHVFWISAEKPELIGAQYKEIKEKLELKEDFLDWLENSDQDYLLIFDNGQELRGLEPHLPRSGGTILITSRNTQWPTDFKMIEIDVFSSNEVLEFAQKCVEKEDREENFEEHVEGLGKALGKLPLALTIAFSYIVSDQSQMSIRLYIQKFNLEREKMLKLGIEGDENFPTVFTTWKITFEKIQTLNSLAAQFLVIISYFPNPDSVSLDYLTYFCLNIEDSLTSSEPIKRILSRYSMLRLELHSFRIHRLVQEVLKIEFRKNCAPNIYTFSGLHLSNFLEEINFYGSMKPIKLDFGMEHFQEIFQVMDKIPHHQQSIILRLYVYLDSTLSSPNTLGIEGEDKELGLLKIINFAKRNFQKIEQNQNFDAKISNLILKISEKHGIAAKTPNPKEEYFSSLLQIILPLFQQVFVTLERAEIPEILKSLVFSLKYNLIIRGKNLVIGDKKILKFYNLRELVAIFENSLILTRKYFGETNFTNLYFTSYLHAVYKEFFHSNYFTVWSLQKVILTKYFGEHHIRVYKCNEILWTSVEILGDPPKLLEIYTDALELAKRLDKLYSTWTEKISELNDKIQQCQDKKSGLTSDEEIARNYEEFGFFLEAIKTWKKILLEEHREQKFHIYLELAYLYNKLFDWGNIITWIKSALEVLLENKEDEEKRARLLKILGNIYSISDDWVKFIEIFEDLAKSEISEENLRKLSFGYFALGEKEKALEVLKELKYSEIQIEKIIKEDLKILQTFKYKKYTLGSITLPILSLQFNTQITPENIYKFLGLPKSRIRREDLEGIFKMIRNSRDNFALDDVQFKSFVVMVLEQKKCLKYKEIINRPVSNFDFSETVEISNEILDIERVIFGRNHFRVYKRLNELIIFPIGKTTQIAYGEEALKIREDNFGKSHIRLVPMLSKMANIYTDHNHLEKGLELWTRVLKILEENVGVDFEGFSAIGPEDLENYMKIVREIIQEIKNKNCISQIEDDLGDFMFKIGYETDIEN